MTERPIIFSGAMVRAILDGSKSMTRRIIKPRWRDGANPAFTGWRAEVAGPRWWQLVCTDVGADIVLPFAFHDTLWVREAWAQPALMPVQYRADPPIRHGHWDGARGPWRPSIHMPRWASRITLLVTDVRVQRLQDISQEDAKAEGATARPNALRGFEGGDGWCMDWSRVGTPDRYGKNGVLTEACLALGSPRMAFASYWNSLHDPGAWDANPWVAAVSFERIDA